MSEYIRKLEHLDDSNRQEVMDFIDFLLSKKIPKISFDYDTYRERIQHVSVWSEDDVKPIEDARAQFEQWRPTQW